MASKTVITCRCCGEPGRHVGHGWRKACHDRWIAAGRPETGPPPPRSPREIGRIARAARGERASRITDYESLSRYRRMSRYEAAAALGVSLRTVERYEAALKASR